MKRYHESANRPVGYVYTGNIDGEKVYNKYSKNGKSSMFYIEDKKTGKYKISFMAFRIRK